MKRSIGQKLWTALDIVRGSLTTEQSVELLLQVLAWKKVSEKIKNAPALESPSVGSVQAFYFNSMNALSSIEALKKWELAFIPSNGNIVGDELSRIVDTIKQIELADISLDDCITLITTPHSPFHAAPSLTDTIVEAVALHDSKKSMRVYAPFDGSLPLALRLDGLGHRVFAEFSSQTALKYCHLLCILFDGKVNAKLGSPVEKPQWLDKNGHLENFDLAVGIPPFGTRYDRSRVWPDKYDRFPEKSLYGEVLQLRHMMAQSKGASLAVISNGLLFRSSAGEKAFKDDLVNSGRVDSVISFPTGFLNSLSLEVSLVTLKTKPSPKGTVFLVDLEKSELITPATKRGPATLSNPRSLFEILEGQTDTSFSRSVTKDEIEENDFDLTPSRYILSEEGSQISQLVESNETQELRSLVEFIRPKYLKPADTDAATELFHEASLADVGENGLLGTPEKKVRISVQVLASADLQKVQPNDILLIAKGSTTGSVCLVPPDIPDRTLANQSFLILRVKTGVITPIYLLRYLTSKIGRELLGRYTGGSAVPMIQFKDLKSLPVVVPPLELIRQVEASHDTIIKTHTEIQNLKKKATESLDQIGDLILGIQ